MPYWIASEIQQSAQNNGYVSPHKLGLLGEEIVREALSNGKAVNSGMNTDENEGVSVESGEELEYNRDSISEGNVKNGRADAESGVDRRRVEDRTGYREVGSSVLSEFKKSETELGRSESFRTDSNKSSSVGSGRVEFEAVNQSREGTRLAVTLGENGAKAFRTVYTPEIARTVPSDVAMDGFRAVYNSAVTGKEMTEVQKAAAMKIPKIMQDIAFDSGKLDAQRAAQATYFGRDSGLIRDDSFKKANLKSRDIRILDAIAKVTGTQIRFVDTINEGSANASYGKGVISISLDSDDPVRVAMMHEVVHRLREVSPESYSFLAKFVTENMSAESYSLAFAAVKSQYSGENTDTISEEVIAHALGTIMGDSKKLDSLIKSDRTTWEKLCDALHDIIVSIKRALRKGSGARLSEEQRRVFSELLDKYEGMESVLIEALRNTTEKVSEMGVEKSGNTQYNEVKESRKAHPGKTTEIQIFENNRYERIRQFHEDLPTEWFAFTRGYFYLYSNESQTDYTILIKARITPKNKPFIDYFIRRVEDGTYRSRDVVNRWISHFRRGKGRYSWNPISLGRGSAANRVDGMDGESSGDNRTRNKDNIGYTRRGSSDSESKIDSERDFYLDQPVEETKYAEKGVISTEYYNQLVEQYGAIPQR